VPLSGRTHTQALGFGALGWRRGKPVASHAILSSVTTAVKLKDFALVDRLSEAPYSKSEVS